MLSTLLDAYRTFSSGEQAKDSSVSKRKATMKNLLMALVAVGLCIGCGGDTSAKKVETKTTSTTTTPGGGTTKTETKDTKEVKTTEKKP